MLLNVYLEELRQKYKTYQFIKNTKQGIQGTVYKGVQTEKNSPKTILYLKEYFNNSEAIREIAALRIIDAINKAYLASGFKTLAMPIPQKIDYDVVNDKIQVLTSGITKTNLKDNKDINYTKKFIQYNKFIFVNAAIGNNDAHSGNIIHGNSISKIYAIDFAYALYAKKDFIVTRASINRLFFEIFSEEDDKLKKKKIERLQKIIFFWKNFLQLNRSKLVQIYKTTINELLTKLKPSYNSNDFNSLKREFKYSLEMYRTELNELLKFYQINFKKLENEYKKIKNIE